MGNVAAIQSDAQVVSEPSGAIATPIFMPPPQRWVLSPSHPEQADNLASSARVPQVIAELLIARGIHDADAAFQFLNPAVEQLFDPFLMLGMEAAVERLERAIERHETILLYGDYDVDGTTAVVLLKTAIEMLGGVVRFHVPHRLREGYGMQASVIEAAAADGVGLAISVDTGMRAFKEASLARRLGLDLIITDHHLPEAGDEVPDALAILNPNQPGCEYPEKSLCGAAIAFKLAIAVLTRHDELRTREKAIPSFLKMVALATVADAVPLRGENRVLASIGIRELHRPAGLGLRALFQAAGVDPTTKRLSSFDLGFRLAPRINAAGRMDIAAEVVELFTTRDGVRASLLAEKLERLNAERRQAETELLQQIEMRLASDHALTSEKMVVMAGDGWHRGIIGILASRIVDRTAKPAIVVSVEDGVAYGSGRSIDGFPLLEAIESCAELYARFGGHAFAVGFAMPAENLPEMERRLYSFAAEKLAGQEAEQVLRIHAELSLERATPVLSRWLKKLEPFGHGNSEPVFLARTMRLAAPVRLMKEKHIRLELRSAAPLVEEAAAVKAVGWNLAHRAKELSLEQGSVVDVAYRIRENDHPKYGGLQIELAGVRLSSE